ncbi:5'-nucleotidase [Clostridiales Family XIII bacterium PM5-7]
MNILVTNDDGIQSPGIKALVAALSKVADVYVCAPDGQRSAKSQSITLGEMVNIQAVEFPFAKGAYQTSGTPADCTKIGLQFFAEKGVTMDMVYAGINMGSNLGKDTLYSGTVGAAMEAAVDGYHAVAVSVDSHEATYFDAACQLAVDVIDLIYGKLDKHTVININTPNLPKEEIKGVRYTTLGDRYYDDQFKRVEENQYMLTGEPGDFSCYPEHFDVCAAHYGYASITPLHFDYTDYSKLDTVKKWSLNL